MGIKDTLDTLLTTVRLLLASSDRHTLRLGTAGLALLVFARYTLGGKKKGSGKGRLLSDPRTIARPLEGDGHEFDEWDFVIVGGGTAGCVLAARLSEDPKLRVLLIEDGGSGKTVLESRVPSGYSKLFRSKYDYHFYTEPQPHAGNRKTFWPRARMLGGCSSINAQMAQYGAPSDFDEWAQIIGDDSWSWKSLNKYFRKFENFKPDPKYPHIDALQRGTSGPVTVGYHSHTYPGAPLFVQAAMAAGIPYSGDFGLETSLKGTNMICIERVSTESAYLTDEVLARPNLRVLTRARVTRILFDREVDGAPCATGVEFVRLAEPRGRKWRVKARKEVILSAGAVHSPQILMLSGVGPAEHLAQHKIALVHDLPGVGQNLVDHAAFYVRFGDKMKAGLSFSQPYNIPTAVKFVASTVQYLVTGTGRLATNVGEAVAFIRSNDPALFPESEWPAPIEDANSGPESPDIELILIPVPLAHNKYCTIKRGLEGYTIIVTNLRPTSAGSIRLKNSDPFDAPLIDPNYLATQHDVDVHVRGARLAYKIAHTAPLTQMTDTANTDRILDNHFKDLSDAELAQVVRERVETLYHPACTCRMAPREQGGVVDKDMRVYGVKGLRVCDASAFPRLVSGHTAGAVIASAEKLADEIKAEYRSSKA
ncbi:alcohol oxidase [Coniophora puteana RWD-64-598 SS2]|uniref:Alcohol oxidase n=1 Tax=Coniophora puteana (strain RWD-64-598) TaxID=741705 RepID=A0A5M3MXM6_CONPW|nr:alcohol oxidase [Coniophora puteana RWD-64-598 SS2]EIW83858.1 alcohol oxidase [Coniophora puteana RWD-64-598 SS2]